MTKKKYIKPQIERISIFAPIASYLGLGKKDNRVLINFNKGIL